MIVEKVGFEPGVKEWWMTRVGMMTEMSWEVDKEVNWDKNGEADGMNLEVDSWCISKWAICDFQRGDGWRARKSDNRWGAGTAKRLKRDDCEDSYVEQL